MFCTKFLNDSGSGSDVIGLCEDKDSGRYFSATVSTCDAVSLEFASLLVSMTPERISRTEAYIISFNNCPLNVKSDFSWC